MNSDIQQKFQEAMQYASRGENYASQGNYQFSTKCYLKVSKILSSIISGTTNEKTVKDLQAKVQKYTDLASEMLKKQKQKQSKKTIISKFGFPTTKNLVSFMKQEEPKSHSFEVSNRQSHQVSANRQSYQVNASRQSQQVDPQIEGMISRNLKFSFQDIVGMDETKQILYQAVILPQKRPDLFEGIRTPPKGILLYGPPGNGKTYIVKALAKQSGCVFYGLSAGSIVNKFVGQSEKMLKKIFISAKKTRPSIIFIDQIDSIITARTQNQNDSTRRLKTQFLIQFDSIQPKDQVILVGATNFPGQLDLAALRRFNKLVYIGLPEKQARQGIIQKNLSDIKYEISKKQMSKLIKDMEGYTVSQITDIIKQASMRPIRQIKKNMIDTVTKSKIRPISYSDFTSVIAQKKPLLTKEDIKKFQGKFR